ncbi:hypothetical protein MKEN_00467200 [Mycena kentingensis (nom. inval.)]|nr:hypothetical protein MKEN_00467200 [Mycena kentingensis (nom. inval.)]
MTSIGTKRSGHTAMFLYPSGPAFRPRIRMGPAAYAATKLSIYTAAPSSDDDDDDDSDSASDADSETSLSSASTAATSVYSVCAVPVSVPAYTTPRTTSPSPTTTRYLYQGGRTNVVSGGVMLGGRARATRQPKPVSGNARTHFNRASTASWRRIL